MRGGAGRRRRGFTIVEMAVASLLMGLLVALLLTTWSAFAKPASEVLARARLAREAALARSALAADLCGTLADPGGRLGGKSDRRLLDWTAPGGNTLRLEFEGGATISYALQADGTLARWDEVAVTRTTVARDLESFTVTPQQERMQVELSFRYRDIARTYTLVASKP